MKKKKNNAINMACGAISATAMYSIFFSSCVIVPFGIFFYLCFINVNPLSFMPNFLNFILFRRQMQMLKPRNNTYCNDYKFIKLFYKQRMRMLLLKFHQSALYKSVVNCTIQLQSPITQMTFYYNNSEPQGPSRRVHIVMHSSASSIILGNLHRLHTNYPRVHEQ